MTETDPTGQPTPDDETRRRIHNADPAKLAANFVVFANNRSGHRHVLVIERRPQGHDDPTAGLWALPGGDMGAGQTLLQTALTGLAAEATVTVDVDRHRPRLVDVFDRPNRDPRHRVISVAYTVLLDRSMGLYNPQAGTGARNVAWIPVDDKGHIDGDITLALDHRQVIRSAATRLRQITIDPSAPGLAERLAEAREAIALTPGVSLEERWTQLSGADRAFAIVDAGHWIRAFAMIAKEG